uniref:Uncharacterized protein n=1 Tax=Anguilla anguilla TaxID=7936 RepID=A0A0E9QU52_ANGAN
MQSGAEARNWSLGVSVISQPHPLLFDNMGNTILSISLQYCSEIYIFFVLIFIFIFG